MCVSVYPETTESSPFVRCCTSRRRYLISRPGTAHLRSVTSDVSSCKAVRGTGEIKHWDNPQRSTDGSDMPIMNSTHDRLRVRLARRRTQTANDLTYKTRIYCSGSQKKDRRETVG